MRAGRSTAAAAVGSAVALQIGVSLPPALVGTLAPYLRDDIGLTAQSLGVTIALFHAVSAATAVRLGRLADTQSWQRGTVLVAGATVVPLLVFGSVVRSVPLLVIALAATAVGHSLAVATGNLAVFHSVPRARQGTAFGIKQAAVPAAMMLAGISASQVADRWGWRTAFLGVLVFPALSLALARRTRGRPQIGEQPPSGQPAALSHDEIVGLRVLAAAIGSASFTASSTGAFFVLFAVHEGFSPADAGTIVAVCSILNILMRVLLGWVADRRAVDGFRLVAGLLVGGAVGYALLATSNRVLILVGAGLGYGLGWAWQGLVHLGAVRLVPGAPGYSSGLIRTGMSAGAGTGPLVSGLVIAAFGYSGLWVMQLLVTCAAATALLMTLRHIARVRAVRPAPYLEVDP